MRAIVCTLFLSGLLCDSCLRAENTLSSLKAAAVAWPGELPCRKWDCECAFKRQRGCCCANNQLQEVENKIFTRIMDLSEKISQLADNVLEVIGDVKIAFTASMSPRTNCFGPFNRNSPIPYDVITLNQGDGYNAALGTFTAPRSALYSFSFSVYSKVGVVGKKLYYKVQLMQNGKAVASTWEDNWEDSEDSSTQTVLLSLQKGGQVYVELLSGRQLCGSGIGLNTFSGALIYPTEP
ncbi:complement C1q 4 [Solea senegalensis]|uniref:Complement C1q 4 n=1 Tax=Solea senegalensis TaxID=28829 RepID=A0AAV6QCJ8_SOLSE|nr:cerebellin 18 [Solea senegalensis]KAG7486574.1 complement C1q 4 [Solea senegalensis]